MFYRELASIANQLNHSRHAIDDLLQIFCMRSLADLHFTGAVFFKLERDGKLHLESFFGVTPEEVGLDEDVVDLARNLPLTRCIKEGDLIWAATSKSDKARGTSRFKSSIAWPVSNGLRTLGSLLVLSENPPHNRDDLWEFARALTEIVGSAISHTILGEDAAQFPESEPRVTHANPIPTELTERQELILKLISEGRTNRDISEILGYSESLIRQETIRIYAYLGCSGRNEAAQLYRERVAPPKEESATQTLMNASR